MLIVVFVGTLVVPTALSALGIIDGGVAQIFVAFDLLIGVGIVRAIITIVRDKYMP